MTAPATAAPWLGVAEGLRYGALGFPLAFVALPLYVVLPNHYAREFAVPLAQLGAVLLVTRLFDALVDPGLGRLVDRRFAVGVGAVLRVLGFAATVLALGLGALLFPPVHGPALLAWASLALGLTFVAYSVVSLVHQGWGARLGGDASQRAQVVAWREGLGLAGVMVASVLPTLGGLPALWGVCAGALVLGVWALAHAPRRFAADAGDSHAAGTHDGSTWLPWQRPAFRRLLGVYVLNGIASAIPATLVLFFVQDVLRAPPASEGLYLGLYFLCAALGVPVWVRVIRARGLVRAWRIGMLMAIVAFAGANTLGAGDGLAFACVCVLTGLALGADLACPGALLAGVIARSGDQNRHEGVYFGWWNFATKLNLALAAGLALPVLEWLGYRPGLADGATSSTPLVLAYAALPCAIKLVAWTALGRIARHLD